MSISFSERLSTSQRIALAQLREKIVNMGKKYAQNRSAMIATVISVTFLSMAIFGPYIAPHDPRQSFYNEDGSTIALEPPSQAHPLGTNHLGRDILSQWIYGARISILIGFAAGFSVLVIGATVGIVAGYYRGTVDLLLMRIVDILYGIPIIPFVLIFALLYGNNFWTIVFAMVVLMWRTMARVIRSQTMSIAERPFVKSARAVGASDLRIMIVHIAPNLVPLMLIEGIFVTATAILVEATISFLGLGPSGVMSWGSMLQLTFSTGAVSHAWWWVIPPGFSITLLVLSLFYISRGLEDATNPTATMDK